MRTTQSLADVFICCLFCFVALLGVRTAHRIRAIHAAAAAGPAVNEEAGSSGGAGYTGVVGSLTSILTHFDGGATDSQPPGRRQAAHASELSW